MKPINKTTANRTMNGASQQKLNQRKRKLATKCKHTSRPAFSKGRCHECSVSDGARKYKSKPKKTAITKKTSTTQILLSIYLVIRPEFLLEHKLCHAKTPNCTINATEIHHKKGRLGIWLIMSEYFLPVCRNCHDYYTKNSAEAIEKGVSIARNSITQMKFTERERELLMNCGLRVQKWLS